MAENGVRDPKLVADQEEPASSADASSLYSWLPKKGTPEWIQYDFAEPAKVSQADVYWFEEQNGGEDAVAFGMAPVVQERLRMEAGRNTRCLRHREGSLQSRQFQADHHVKKKNQPKYSAAISEWRIN